MKEEHKKKIEEIMKNMECVKGFKCAENNFEHLCKANDLGIKDYIDCLEEISINNKCPFAFAFGYGFLCKCPVRVYIAKNLKK